ncbi:MAG: DUF1730 domain-containing protein [Thermoguttaceae bacterium]|nr:DUF1730 domain-containing protein [Thermoguttaceae bacterium]
MIPRSDPKHDDAPFGAPTGADEKGVAPFLDGAPPASPPPFPPVFYELRALARELGLAALGLAPAGDAASFDVFLKRVREGYCANLAYLTDEPEKRRSPRSVLPDVKTVVAVALSEKRLREESSAAADALLNAPELRGSDADGQPSDARRGGAVLGYATCLDYHDVLRKKLKALAAFFKERFPDAATRIAVDTAPLLEKDWASAAGLGFVGLNSLLVVPGFGSRVFLGELLVSVPFETLCGYRTRADYLAARAAMRVCEGERTVDYEKARDACLTCRRCLDACPTEAIVGDRTIDSRRCLNYWTIENRDEIPDDIAQKLDGRLFGCDLCQQVCPWNADVDRAAPRELPLDAVERLDDATFRKLFKKTPIFRATVDGLKRVSSALRKEEEQQER